MGFNSVTPSTKGALTDRNFYDTNPNSPQKFYANELSPDADSRKSKNETKPGLFYKGQDTK